MGIWNDLSQLDEIKIPRCYYSRLDKIQHHEIHSFSDASDKAYAAVVYLRTKRANGNVEVRLIAAKTRVELLGALILARLVNSILEALKSIKVDNVFLWTDSFTTLCWIKNNKSWKQYVQNRVQEIRELTDTESW